MVTIKSMGNTSSSYTNDDSSDDSSVDLSSHQRGVLNREGDKRGVVVLDANQRLVGDPHYMNLDRVEEVTTEALSLGQTVRVFNDLESTVEFLESRKVHVLFRVDGVL